MGERKIIKALRRFVLFPFYIVIYERQLQTRVCLLYSSRASLCSLEGLLTDARAVGNRQRGSRYTIVTRARGCGGGTVCSPCGTRPEYAVLGISLVYILNKTTNAKGTTRGRRTARESGDHTTLPSSRTAGSGRFAWGDARRRPPILRPFRGG